MRSPVRLPRRWRGLQLMLRRFSPLVRPQWPLLAGAAAMLIAEVALRLLEPWPIKYVLDGVLADGAGQDSPAPALAGLGDEALLALSAGAVAALAALRAGAAYASTIALALAGNRVLTGVRADVYRHLLKLDLGFHHKNRSGDLIHRLVGDIGRLQEVAVTAALPLAVNSLTLVGMVAVMAWLNWQLTLVSVALLPLFLPWMARRGKTIRGAARNQRHREGAMASLAAESIGAIKVVQALGLDRTLEARFSSRNVASLRDGVQAKRLAAGLERRVDLLAGVGSALVVFFGARQVQAGALTPGELIVFLLYLKTAFKPMRDLAKYTGRLASASASGERVLEVLDAVPAIRDRADSRVAPRLRGDISFESVTLAYARALPALHDVDLRVAAGERVAIVGPSGAGKSSLISLLLRLYDPDVGRVTIDGHDIRTYTIESLRAQIAVVLQDSVLFGMSVRENIAFGAPEASDREVEDAARLANAHGFIEQLPDGYDSVIGERGATLSGGQRQRIAIARAAIRDAPIVVLDEPTTGLDGNNEREVIDALHRLAKGRTTILVTHDLEAAAEADRIVWVEGGRITEFGTHTELMSHDGAYATAMRGPDHKSLRQPS